MSANGPEPICAVCKIPASKAPLKEHGKIWLCAYDENRVDGIFLLDDDGPTGDCQGVHEAAELKWAMEMAQG